MVYEKPAPKTDVRKLNRFMAPRFLERFMGISPLASPKDSSIEEEDSA